LPIYTEKGKGSIGLFVDCETAEAPVVFFTQDKWKAISQENMSLGFINEKTHYSLVIIMIPSVLSQESGFLLENLKLAATHLNRHRGVLIILEKRDGQKFVKTPRLELLKRSRKRLSNKLVTIASGLEEFFTWSASTGKERSKLI